MSHFDKTLHALLTDAIYELGQVKARLENVAEMLVSARNIGSGLDITPDDERHGDGS